MFAVLVRIRHVGPPRGVTEVAECVGAAMNLSTGGMVCVPRIDENHAQVAAGEGSTDGFLEPVLGALTRAARLGDEQMVVHDHAVDAIRAHGHASLDAGVHLELALLAGDHAAKRESTSPAVGIGWRGFEVAVPVDPAGAFAQSTRDNRYHSLVTQPCGELVIERGCQFARLLAEPRQTGAGLF